MRFDWMSKVISVTALLLLVLSGSLAAMPPHPDIIDKYRKEGRLPELMSKMKSMKAKGMNSPQRSFPTSGVRKVLVFLVNYSDTTFVTNSTDYDTLFNVDSYGWRQYYLDMSNSALDLQFDVYGTYAALNTHFSYGANDGFGFDIYPGTLVGEAIDAAEAAGVNFAPYDNDGDGNVDAVIVIHQGTGEEVSGDANDIWSHRWNLDSANFYGDGPGARTYDTVTINDYAIQPEFVTTAGDSTIGVFVHEFGHVLGLPDLYDTSYTTEGIGVWGVMSSGSWLGPSGIGGRPAPISAWSKIQLGWAAEALAEIVPPSPAGKNIIPSPGKLLIFLLILAAFLLLLIKKRRPVVSRIASLPTVILALSLAVMLQSCPDPGSQVTLITLQDIESSHKAAVVPLGDSGGDEFLVIENKNKITGTWTEYLPGGGLLISHIDKGIIASKWGLNTINAGSQHGVNILEADGDNALWTGDNSGSFQDPFYEGNRSSLLNPSLNEGGDSIVKITSISSIASQMSFYIER